MKLIFMGTPAYAVNTLNALLEAGHEILGVFAQPDKPVGRKHVVTPPPVKVCAEEHGIPVYQPNNWKDGEAAKIVADLAPEVIVVVAYGKILPEEVLAIPPYGCINGHASLLPAYRGASPIQWCIVSGETKTGVTTMLMDKGMDTGDILETVMTDIGSEETADELFDRLAPLSAELMVKTLADLESGGVIPKKQPETGISYAPIIKKEMAMLTFQTKTARELHNAARGFYSWPCAYFFYNGKRVKVLKTALSDGTSEAPGTVFKRDKRLLVACKAGTTLELMTVQPEGGKPMSGYQMLCGGKLPLGSVIGG